jgi:hypothetical protein
VPVVAGWLSAQKQKDSEEVGPERPKIEYSSSKKTKVSEHCVDIATALQKKSE